MPPSPSWHGCGLSVPLMCSLTTLQNTLWKPVSTLGSDCVISFFLKRSKGGTQDAIHFIQRKAVSFFFFLISFPISNMLFGYGVISSISKKSEKEIPFRIGILSLGF